MNDRSPRALLVLRGVALFALAPLLSVATSGSASSAAEALPRSGDSSIGRLLGPLSSDEETLRRTTLSARSGVRVGVQESLRTLSAASPGTPVSGLAQIALADLALGGGRNDEAATAGRHADVERAGLSDVGLLIAARARARQADYSGAASLYLGARDASPIASTRCDALRGAAGAFGKIAQPGRQVEALREASGLCRDAKAATLLSLGEALRVTGDKAGALAAFEEVERDFPLTDEAKDASLTIKAIGRPPQEDFERRMARARALVAAGQRTNATVALRGLVGHPGASASDNEEIRASLALALGNRSPVEVRRLAKSVSPESPFSSQAELALARIAPERDEPTLLLSVADRFPGTEAAAQALFDLGNHYQKDAFHSQAATYYRRLAAEYPDSPNAERAALRAAFDSLRNGRLSEGATTFESMARRSRFPAAFLYWAGIARSRNNENDRGLALLREASTRFKNTWHGQRAVLELASSPQPAASDVKGPVFQSAPATIEPLDGALTARLRSLVLAGLHEEAIIELSALESPASYEARALIEADRGELRSAIIAMKRAYPTYVAAAPSELPPHVWTTIYPLRYDASLKNATAREALDPALVAALVCQESTFSKDAVSAVGARGLMQIMTYTGKPLAAGLGLRFNRNMLHDPDTSLLLGTRYFRQLLDRFSKREDAALAAYNAGPHRVDKWLGPNQPVDEFVESIPFSETRLYVMTILASRAQYELLYGLKPSTTAAASASN